MATRRVLLLLGFAIVAMMTAAAATESVKVLTNAADKVAEASARSAVGGDPLVKVSTRTVGEDEGANTASSLALASLSSKAATAGSHLVKVTSGVDVLMETASRMDTDVARPMTSSAAAATAEATDKGNPSLVGTASSRKVTASSVDAVIRSVSASSNRDAVIKVTRALALAFLGERQLQFQYHGKQRIESTQRGGRTERGWRQPMRQSSDIGGHVTTG